MVSQVSSPSDTYMSKIDSHLFELGRGGLVLYEEVEGRGFVEFCRYQWGDGLFDVTWSELSEDVLVVGGGDGNVVVFDWKLPQGPAAVLSGHTAEVISGLP